VEVAMVVDQPGERGRGHGDAVIRFDPADDLLFVRSPERIVHVPDQLDLAVVRFGSRRAEEYLRRRNWRDLLEPLGKLDCGIVALAGEQVSERQLAHLRRRRLDQLRVAIAERRAPQPGHALDIGLSLVVVDAHALPALEDERSGLAERGELGVGVNQRLDVAGGEIAERGHGMALDLRRRERAALAPNAATRHGWISGRGRGSGTLPGADSSSGSRTSHWHMR